MQHDIELTDRRLAAIVRRMHDLPGEELFQYVDEQGEARAVESADVNSYLRESAGAEFTSKDFRTWAGTLLCARVMCYIHPAILESYLEGELQRLMRGRSDEAGVVAVLRERLKRDADEAKRSGASGRSLAPLLARSLERLQRAAA